MHGKEQRVSPVTLGAILLYEQELSPRLRTWSLDTITATRRSLAAGNDFEVVKNMLTSFHEMSFFNEFKKKGYIISFEIVATILLDVMSYQDELDPQCYNCRHCSIQLLAFHLGRGRCSY